MYKSMKKMRFILFAVAAIATVSCVKEMAQEATTDAVLVPMTFSASAENEADTKVVLQSDKKSVHWASTDQIKVFDGISNELPAFTTTESGASVTFAGQVSEGATGTFYALYPYQADATYAETAQTSKGYGMVIKANVPAEQTAVANGIAPEAYIAAAKSDDYNNFYFKPVLGFIKFQLSAEDAANAVAVSLSGNDLAAITGNIEIFFQQDKEGTVVDAFGQTYINNQMNDYVTLKGTFAADTDYYFAIRSNAFASGFTMTVLYADGSCKHVTSTKAAPQTVSRGYVMNIGKPVFVEGAPADQYIAWMHGATLDVAGIKYNKAKYGNATYAKSNMTASATGVYFVNTDITFKMSLNAFDQPMLVFGRYKDTRSNMTLSKICKFGGAEAEVVFKDLNITFDNNNQPFQVTANSKAIVIDNCNFNHIRNTFITCNISNPATKSSVETVSITNSEVKINGTNKEAAYMFLSGYDQTVVSSFVFKNNVVYFVPGTKEMTDFKVIEVKSGTAENIIVENNTFDKTTVKASDYLVRAKAVSGQLVIKNNLFNEVSAASDAYIVGLSTKEGTIPTSGEVTNNFYYTANSENTALFKISTNGLDNLSKKYNPQRALDPIFTDWDPDNGKYSIATSVTYYNTGSQQNVTLSTTGMGAVR